MPRERDRAQGWCEGYRGEVERLIDRAQRAEAEGERLRTILRDLTADQTAGYHHFEVDDTYKCRLCEVEPDLLSGKYPHRDSCPYARARAALASPEEVKHELG